MSDSGVGDSIVPSKVDEILPAVAESKTGEEEATAGPDSAAPSASGDDEMDELENQISAYEAKLGSITEEIEQLEQGMPSLSEGGAGDEGDYDETSVYVGQVDYNASAEEVQAHFMSWRPGGSRNHRGGSVPQP